MRKFARGSRNRVRAVCGPHDALICGANRGGFRLGRSRPGPDVCPLAAIPLVGIAVRRCRSRPSASTSRPLSCLERRGRPVVGPGLKRTALRDARRRAAGAGSRPGGRAVHGFDRARRDGGDRASARGRDKRLALAASGPEVPRLFELTGVAAGFAFSRRVTPRSATFTVDHAEPALTAAAPPLTADAALLLGIAATAMPFAQSLEEQAERWLRALRRHGEAGAVLASLGVREAPVTRAGRCPSARSTLVTGRPRRSRSSTDHAPATSPPSAAPPSSPLATSDVLRAVIHVYGQTFERVLAATGRLGERRAPREQRTRPRRAARVSWAAQSGAPTSRSAGAPSRNAESSPRIAATSSSSSARCESKSLLHPGWALAGRRSRRAAAPRRPRARPAPWRPPPTPLRPRRPPRSRPGTSSVSSTTARITSWPRAPRSRPRPRRRRRPRPRP